LGHDSEVIERALLLNGTVGSGKTTIAEHVAEALAAKHVPHAWVDLDAVSEMWPRPDDDPFNVAVIVKNIGALGRTYAEAGAARLVLAGVVLSLADLRRLEQAVGCRITVVRLRAAPEKTAARLRQRHGAADHARLAWHLARAPELEAVLDSSDLPMVEVPNDRRPGVVAQLVIAAAGWE
jgi:gluconate kinase